MNAALSEIPQFAQLEPRVLQATREYFRFTAFYIVEGRLLLNDERLVGYGGAMHDGRR